LILALFKQFWARTAFVYYAAALLVGALALFWLTPWRNARMLNENKETAAQAVQVALTAQEGLGAVTEEHEELYRRLERIDLNASSGEFFLRLLDALKDPRYMPNDVWLTSMSTTLPSVVLKESEPATPSAGGLAEPGTAPKHSAAAAIVPDTFQAQAKVYLRGFVRSAQKEDLYDVIRGDRTKVPFVPGFCDKLVPHPEKPDHEENVFRDIRPVWIETEDHRSGTGYIKEFVLEAFVEGTREIVKQSPGALRPLPAFQAAPGRPAAGGPGKRPGTKSKPSSKSVPPPEEPRRDW